jgi:hypothetical protein
MFRVTLSAAFVFAVYSISSAADPAAIEPFNGKDLSGWMLKDKKKSHWDVKMILHVNPDNNMWVAATRGNFPPSLVNTEGHSCDIYTAEKFGDIHLELEFMVPKGSNSGIYLMGEYEVQILDSYGKPDDKLAQSDLGALYSAAAPKKNAAKKPGEWQKFVIDFQAPKFEGGKKTANAKFIKVVLNDVVLHENVEMKQQTPGGLTGKEAATGPLMFQGDHGAVAFRNIKITPRK